MSALFTKTSSAGTRLDHKAGPPEPLDEIVNALI
jgi:hypothetical protein